MKKTNAKLTQEELECLSSCSDGDLLKKFPNHTRKYLREAKRSILDKPQLEQRMKDVGVTESELFELLRSQKKPKPRIIQRNLGGKKFRFGVVSDTHLGSKYEALDELHTFYKRCKDSGCEFIVNAGDLTDGSAAMHKGFLYELDKLGADDQIDHVIENYPNGLTTYFIQGNHDESHFKQNGTSIARGISQRKDLIHVGDVEADIEINGLIIRLYHGGSTAYALSYPAQKYINGIQGGSKPNILILGHLHSSYYLPYRNIHALGAGCFQWQTRFLRSKGITPVIGGWIVEVEHRDGEILSFNPQFAQFYGR